MNFTAIDFETSNGKNACAIGIAVVKNGKITKKKQWLIKPCDMYFNPYTVEIHGITEYDVKDKPEFDKLWKTEISKYFEPNETIVAHNATFDIAVLMHCLDLYNIPYPDINYTCTLVLGKKLWPDMTSHKLNVLADKFDIEFKHHDALEDALTCAKVALKGCEETNVSSLNELSANFLVDHGRLFPKNNIEKLKINKPFKKKPVTASLNKTDKENVIIKSEKLTDQTFVIGGIFENYDGKELIISIIENGGKCISSVSKKTNWILVGKNITPSKLNKAKELGISTLSEQDYIDMIS